MYCTLNMTKLNDMQLVLQLAFILMYVYISIQKSVLKAIQMEERNVNSAGKSSSSPNHLHPFGCPILPSENQLKLIDRLDSDDHLRCVPAYGLNSVCVSKHKRCDNVSDCRNHQDEINCGIVPYFFSYYMYTCIFCHLLVNFLSLYMYMSFIAFL